jgi:hypothetical protein
MRNLPFHLVAISSLVVISTGLWAQCPPGAPGCNNQQQQSQTSTNNNTIFGGSPVGGIINSYGSEYALSWPILPGGPPTGFAFNQGPARWNKKIVAMIQTIKYWPVWTVSELEEYANRPGEVRISESFRKTYPPTVKIEFWVVEPTAEHLAAFNRSYEYIGNVAIDGIGETDSLKLLGDTGINVTKKGADLVIFISEGGTLEMYQDSKHRNWVAGLFLQAPGPGVLPAGGLGMYGGNASARAGYDTLPFVVANAYHFTGVPYRPVGPEQQQGASGQPLWRF